MRPVPRWFIAICWTLATLFCVCVGLQVNDPDPVRWMAIYGVAAVVCGVLPAHRMLAFVALAVALAAGTWATYLASHVANQLELSDLWMKMSEKGGAVEVGREAGGLALVSFSLIVASIFRATRS